MIEKLDKLADKWGLNLQNFDQVFNKIVYGEKRGLDEFMNDAQQIYSELYKVGDRHPIEFLNRIFDVTKQKLSMKGNNRKNLEDALQKFGIHPIKKIENHNILKTPKGFTKARQIINKNQNANNNDDEDKKGDAAAPGVPKKDGDGAKDGKAGVRDMNAVINDQGNLDKLNKFLKKKKK